MSSTLNKINLTLHVYIALSAVNCDHLLFILRDLHYRNQLERVRSKADTYDRELSVICSNELPALIEKSSQSKEAFIIAGDYNLKLARQQYFLDCQDQVIFC